MPRLMVTGASGYIGQRLCALAADRGWEIVVLGTAPSIGRIERRFDWHLGEPVPSAAFEGVAAVVHLAHSWKSDSEQRTSSTNVNLAGTEKFVQAAFDAGVPRFVFASTTSARPEALNAYGQIKFALEELLLASPMATNRINCARIGLVYGGPETGMYGLLSKLVRLTPILPMVALERKVQPIHLDEVVEGLLVLASRPAASQGGMPAGICVLAGPDPITFGDLLRLLRRAHTGKGLVLLRVPVWMALLGCDLSRLIPFTPTIDRERVLGLVGTSPMESASNLAALDLKIIPPARRLAVVHTVRMQMIAEARAMLSYVSGENRPPKAATARLVRAFDRQGAEPLGIPRSVVNCPWLLRVFEPLRARTGHRLAERLHLAVMVAESMREQRGRRRNLLSLLGLAFLEVTALPFRLLLGRHYA
jgi:nucleoside-diphosphate-sugar epimerase